MDSKRQLEHEGGEWQTQSVDVDDIDNIYIYIYIYIYTIYIGRGNHVNKLLLPVIPFPLQSQRCLWQALPSRSTVGPLELLVLPIWLQDVLMRNTTDNPANVQSPWW